MCAQFLRAVHFCGVAPSKKNGVMHMIDVWLVLVILILQGICKSDSEYLYSKESRGA